MSCLSALIQRYFSQTQSISFIYYVRIEIEILSFKQTKKKKEKQLIWGHQFNAHFYQFRSILYRPTKKSQPRSNVFFSVWKEKRKRNKNCSCQCGFWRCVFAFRFTFFFSWKNNLKMLKFISALDLVWLCEQNSSVCSIKSCIYCTHIHPEGKDFLVAVVAFICYTFHQWILMELPQFHNAPKQSNISKTNGNNNKKEKRKIKHIALQIKRNELKMCAYKTHRNDRHYAVYLYVLLWYDITCRHKHTYTHNSDYERI